MKRINTYLILQYMSLVAIAAIPVLLTSFISSEIKRVLPALATILFVLISLLIITATFITEITCVANTRKLLKTDRAKAIKIWKRLKLATIPFYILNLVIIIILAPTTFPFSLFVFPLDGLLFIIMIVISGTLGISVLKTLDKKPIKIHNVLQLIPVLDVISTLTIKTK